MHSNLPLPKLLEIISRIVNDSGCTVRIVDEIPVQDKEIRELCLQIASDLVDFSKYIPGLSVLPVYGGSSIQSQIHALREGAPFF